MRIKKRVVIQKMGSTFVAYDNETSTLHELNEVGYLILSRIERGKAKAEIIKEIVASFNVSKKKAKEDYQNFLESLKKKDLIASRK